MNFCAANTSDSLLDLSLLNDVAAFSLLSDAEFFFANSDVSLPLPSHTLGSDWAIETQPLAWGLATEAALTTAADISTGGLLTGIGSAARWAWSAGKLALGAYGSAFWGAAWTSDTASDDGYPGLNAPAFTQTLSAHELVGTYNPGSHTANTRPEVSSPRTWELPAHTPDPSAGRLTSPADANPIETHHGTAFPATHQIDLLTASTTLPIHTVMPGFMTSLQDDTSLSPLSESDYLDALQNNDFRAKTLRTLISHVQITNIPPPHDNFMWDSQRRLSDDKGRLIKPGTEAVALYGTAQSLLNLTQSSLDAGSASSDGTTSQSRFLETMTDIGFGHLSLAQLPDHARPDAPGALLFQADAHSVVTHPGFVYLLGSGSPSAPLLNALMWQGSLWGGLSNLNLEVPQTSTGIGPITAGSNSLPHAAEMGARILAESFDDEPINLYVVRRPEATPEMEAANRRAALEWPFGVGKPSIIRGTDWAGYFPVRTRADELFSLGIPANRFDSLMPSLGPFKGNPTFIPKNAR